MCLEKRTFYRMVSGLHTSINTHLSANYFFPRKLFLFNISWVILYYILGDTILYPR